MRYLVASIGITCSSAMFSQQASVVTEGNANLGRFFVELIFGVSEKNLTELGTRLQEKCSREKGSIVYHPQKKHGSVVVLSEDDIANMALNGLLQLGVNVYNGSSVSKTATNVTKMASTIYISRKIDQAGALAAEKAGLTKALEEYPLTYALVTAAGRTISSLAAATITDYIASNAAKKLNKNDIP